MTKKRFLRAALTAAAVVLTAAALLGACEQAGAPSAAEQPAAKPPGSDPSSPSSPGTETGTKLGSITVTVAAVGNPSPGPSQSVAAALSIAAAAPKSVARTVVPVISDSVFNEITVTFSGGTTINGDMSNATVDGDTITKTFYLPPGTYTLTVTGKKGGNSIAVGETSSVVIDDTEKTVKATVLLSPKTGGDLADGIFGYAITLPKDDDAVAVATLTLTDAGGNSVNDSASNPVNFIDLTSNATGTVEKLLPGEYRLKVFLEKEDGNGEIATVPPEVVYIYSTLTSTFTWDFSKITLIKTKGPLELTMSFGPTTIADKEGLLSYQQGTDSPFTLTVSATDFTGVAWNLDGTVLTEVADGVNGNTYTPPTTLKVGTHFMTVTAQSTANNANYSEIVQFTVEKQ